MLTNSTGCRINLTRLCSRGRRSNLDLKLVRLNSNEQQIYFKHRDDVRTYGK